MKDTNVQDILVEKGELEEEDNQTTTSDSSKQRKDTNASTDTIGIATTTTGSTTTTRADRSASSIELVINDNLWVFNGSNTASNSNSFRTSRSDSLSEDTTVVLV